LSNKALGSEKGSGKIILFKCYIYPKLGDQNTGCLKGNLDMDLKVFSTCVAFSVALMILFILINYPYYKMSYGAKARGVILRTVLLNILAICIGWTPVVYFWPDFSKSYLLPAACVVGALGCVGSRFIYHEIVPEELGKTLLQLLERKRNEQKET
jgi:CDP-diglyceride synthetase